MQTSLVLLLALSSVAATMAQVPAPSLTTPGCTIALSASGDALSYTGTSTNGFSPTTTVTFTATSSAACGTAPLTVTVSFPLGPYGRCGFVGSAPPPPAWLTASIGGGTVTFSAFSNPTVSARSAAITVANGMAPPQTYTVTETANTTDPLLGRLTRALYQQILGREPDLGGFNFWTGPGSAGLGVLVDGFLKSPETMNSDFEAIAMYQAVTGAPPSFAQYTATVTNVRANGAAAGFAALVGGHAFDAAFAVSLYQNMLGRAPTSTELSAALGNPSGAYGAFTSIFTGAEFQNAGLFHTTPAADHTNGLFVRMLYFVILGRDPDPGGYEFWLGVANGGGPGIYFQPQNSAAGELRLQILYVPPFGGFIPTPEFGCPLML